MIRALRETPANTGNPLADYEGLQYTGGTKLVDGVRWAECQQWDKNTKALSPPRWRRLRACIECNGVTHLVLVQRTFPMLKCDACKTTFAPGKLTTGDFQHKPEGGPDGRRT